MKFDLKSPCDNCPFRNDINFYLHPERRQEIADSLLNDHTFPCHKTTPETSSNKDIKKIQHCAGALIVMLKSGEIWDNFLFRLAAISKMLKPEEMDMQAPVFGSLNDFVKNSVCVPAHRDAPAKTPGR